METTATAPHTGEVDTQRMTPQEAVVALLIAGARADGSVSPSEADRIEHSVAVMRLFRGYSHEALGAIFATAMKRLEREGSAALLRVAASAIPAELRATVFAITVDLPLADGRSRRREEGFARALQELLGVDDTVASRVVDVLTVKNAG